MAAPERTLGGLVRTSGIYFAGGLAQQAVGFLLLPLYLSVLSPAEYGTLEIMNTTGVIAVMILTLGVPSAIVKCYHRDCAGEAQREAILTTSLALSAPALLLGCIVIAGSGQFAASFSANPEVARLLLPVGLWVLFSGVSQAVLALFRTREEAAILTALSLGSVAVAVSLNIALVYFLRWSVAGILWSNVVSAAFTILLAAPLLRRRIRLSFDPELVRPLLTFGLFVVPAAVAGWMMSISNRYILGYYDQLDTVGVYGLGYKLGMMMEVLVVAPFQLAWPAFAFAISSREDHKETYARALTYLLAVGILVILALSHLTRPLLQLIGTVDYLQAHTVAPVVALGCLFSGVCYCVSPGMHIKGETRWLPVLIGGATALNLGLNFWWIPSFGMLGAAWATTVAFAVLALATVVVSTAVYPVRYEYTRLVKVCVAGAGAYLVGRVAHGESMWVNAAVGTAAVASFPLLLAGLGFLASAEKALLADALRGRWLRRANRGLAQSTPAQSCGPVKT